MRESPRNVGALPGIASKKNCSTRDNRAYREKLAMQRLRSRGRRPSFVRTFLDISVSARPGGRSLGFWSTLARPRSWSPRMFAAEDDAIMGSGLSVVLRCRIDVSADPISFGRNGQPLDAAPFDP